MQKTTESHFADRLIGRLRQLGHPLCVGLDPHLDLIPPLFRRASMAPGDLETSKAVEHFLCTVVSRVAARVAVVKPQVAFFEALGAPGMAALTAVVGHARSLGLEVLLDAKRGDIGSTARAYGAAYLEPGAPCAVDAMTLNPYLGLDTLLPLLDTATAAGRGVFILVKTSNPGSGDFQDQRLASGETLYEAVAKSLAEPAANARGAATGFSSLGVVVGATFPAESERVRSLLPHSLFLVPGYGAQGASAVAALRGFVPGPAGREGGLVSSSRGILFPAANTAAGAAGWDYAFDQGLRRATHELGEAVAS